MTSRALLQRACLLLVVACLVCLADPGQADPTAQWYTPAPADFWPIYTADRANQARQQWDGDEQYWYWVQMFYEDHTQQMVIFTRRVVGWTHSGQDLLAKVSNDATRSRLIEKMNVLGRRVAGEWAKDNGIRRISTDDLTRWGAQLQDANRADTGNGVAIGAAIDRIQAQVDSVLPASPAFRPPAATQPASPSLRRRPNAPPPASGLRLTGIVRSVGMGGFVMEVETVETPDGTTTTLSPRHPKQVRMPVSGSPPVLTGWRVTVTGTDSGPGTPLRARTVVLAPR